MSRTVRTNTTSTMRRRRRLRDRLPARLRALTLRHPAVWGTLLAFLVAALTLLLAPVTETTTLDIEANSVARQDYRAPRTFTLKTPDPAAEARAREAESRVPRVYRHDGAIREAQLRVLRDTGETLRTLCVARRDALEEMKGERDGSVREIQATLEAAGDDVDTEELERRLETTRERFSKKDAAIRAQHEDAISRARAEAMQRLGADVSPASLDVLLDACFPEELLRKATSLLGWILEERIVDQKSELLSEIERGIDVIQPDGATERVGELDAFLSRRGAQGRVTVAANRLFAVRHEDAIFGDARLRDAFVDLVTGLVVPTLRYDVEASRQARREARAAIDTTREVTHRADEVIVRKGEVVTPEMLDLLRVMYAGRAPADRYRVRAGTAIVVLLFLALVYIVGTRHVGGLHRTPRDLLLIGVVLLLHVGLLRLSIAITGAVTAAWEGIPAVAYYLSLPFAMGAMFVRLLVGPRAAVLYAFVLALFAGILLDGVEVTQFAGSVGLYSGGLVFLGSLAGVARMVHIRKRASYLQAGLVIAGVNALLVIGFCLLDATPLSFDTLFVVIGAAASGITSALLVSAVTPAFEWAFGYVTDIKLLELGSLNQPVLKRLILEAPGTYHHSFLVGNLVESAAESIGANPLLARVAALYHDLGKLKNPPYFAENQRRGENRHDKLLPTMSALIIKAHVRDSVRFAEDSGLGRELIDIIEQHHGTTLIQYFYRRALEQHDGSGAPPPESDFRYPGPKPQTREAGLVLLADSVEAAVRSIPEKSPSRIQGMVHNIVLDKFQDGQLDECDLTLRDLNQIERIFTTVLQGVHHARPEYPDRQKTQSRPRLVAVAGDRDR